MSRGTRVQNSASGADTCGMIRHTSTRKSETLTDAVGCLRAFGSLFVVTGTGALSIAAFGLAGMDTESLGARGAVALIGAAHLAGGLLVGWGRWTQTVATRGGLVITERRPLRRSMRRHLAPGEVRDILLLDEKEQRGRRQVCTRGALAHWRAASPDAPRHALARAGRGDPRLPAEPTGPVRLWRHARTWHRAPEA